MHARDLCALTPDKSLMQDYKSEHGLSQSATGLLQAFYIH